METGAGRSLAARERGGVEAGLESPQNSRSLRGVSEEGVAWKGAGPSFAIHERGGAKAGPDAPRRTVAALRARLGRRGYAEGLLPQITVPGLRMPAGDACMALCSPERAEH